LHRPSRFTPARRAAPPPDGRGAARAGPAGARRGARRTAAPCRGPGLEHGASGSGERLPARPPGPSRDTPGGTPSLESPWPAGHCSGGAWRRGVSPASLPEVLPANVMPGVAFPPVGPVGRGSPPAPGLGAATTPPCPSRVASLVARFPIPRRLHGVRGVPLGRRPWEQPPRHARALGHPVPYSGSGARRQVVLPRSRVPPLQPGPALSPRGCPVPSPLSPPGLWPSGACQPSAFASLPRRLSS